MRLTLSLLLGGACIAMLPAPAAAQDAPAVALQDAAATGGSLSVPPLAYHFRELPNGLRVYAMPDPGTANVAVQVWYNVGSKDDPAGRSGFAHLFEHIMFKATRNMAPQQFDRLTEDVGGYNNASTADDYTDYYEVVPANHLERILWAEAERMGSLVIDEATFASERDVVKEELRQRVLASPYGPLFYLYLAQANFEHHPYGRPGIGSIADLDAATVEDVRAFHATYYRPDNAVLAVAGNFDEAEFDRWVDRYFGAIPRPAQPIPRVDTVEPLRTAPRSFDVYQANVPLPAVVVSFPQPAARSPDLPALMMLDAIMAKGESSRLYQALVQSAPIAAEIFTNLDPSKDPGAYSLAAILSEGTSVEAGLTALNAQIARVRDTAPSAAELAEARNEIVTARLRERETAEGRAAELADAVIRYGDAAYADRLLAALQAVTAADVQRVARAILAPERSVTIRYRPEASRAEGGRADSIATAATVVARPLAPRPDAPVVTLAAENERVAPPPPGAPVTAALPPVAEQRLANGLKVIVVPSRRVPLLSVTLTLASGDSADPADRAGLAELTAGLVAKGTAGRDATATARAIESLGAEFATASTADASIATLETRADRADAAMAVMADSILHPALAVDELDRARQQALDGISVAMSEPGSIARRVAARAVFGDAPYGRVMTPTSLARIDRGAVSSFHAGHWRPDNGVLVIAGDIDPASGFALAQRHFGGWVRPAMPLPARPDVSAGAPAPRTIIVDLAGTGQAAVLMGVRGAARRDADYFPALVATTVLGGGYSARLNDEIRIKRGLSYGAGAGMPSRLAAGPVYASAQTRNDAVVEVAGLIEGEIARLGREPVGAAELTARKATLIGEFGREVETTAGLSGAIAELALFGLPPSDLADYVADVAAVTPEAVQAAAQRHFDPARADLVVVGDAAQFGDALAARRPGAERIAADALDLDSEALKR